MKKRAYGFTIVELLIVIVVIAILAAISIVAYRGIQDRANQSGASSKVSQAVKSIQLYFAENDRYPDNLTAAGVADVSDFSYTVNNTSNPKVYCITATFNNTSYYMNNTTNTAPTKGGCVGHSQGGAPVLTNYVRNPSVRNDITGWTPSNLVRVADAQAQSGYAVEKVASSAQVALAVSGLPTGVTDGIFGIDVWLTADDSQASRSARLWAEQANSPWTQWGEEFITVTKTRQRFYLPFTKPSLHTITVIGIRNVGGYKIRASSAFLTFASGQPAFYDGNSPSWMWNGAPDDSTSTGPAL